MSRRVIAPNRSTTDLVMAGNLAADTAGESGTDSALDTGTEWDSASMAEPQAATRLAPAIIRRHSHRSNACTDAFAKTSRLAIRNSRCHFGARLAVCCRIGQGFRSEDSGYALGRSNTPTRPWYWRDTHPVRQDLGTRHRSVLTFAERLV